MKLSPSILIFLVLAVQTAGDLCAVRDLGCVPNDATVDNGAILTAAIRDGRVNDTVHFPGGVYYYSTTIDDNRLRGLSFVGQGLADWCDEGTARRYAKSATIFVYNGPTDRPDPVVAWRLRGLGHRIQGINIWPGFRPLKGTVWAGPVNGTGLAISRADIGPPSGKHSIDHLCVAGWDKGIFFTGPNHADTVDIGFVRAEMCRSAIACDNMQANGINIRMLAINGPADVAGRGEIGNVFDFNRGGGLHVGTLVIKGPRLIFRLRKTDSNTCTYRIDNLKVDPGSTGWRLVEQMRSGPLNLYVRGHIGVRAIVGANPIILRKPVPTATWTQPKDYQYLDVELWGTNPGGKGALWRPKAEDYR
jgi:hypothetical protein